MPQGKTQVSSSGFVRPLAYTLKASAAETASTTGSAIEITDTESLSVLVNVTAASGTTPTMTVVIEGSNDGSNWYTLATFGANGYAPGSVATAPSNFTAAASARGCIPNPGLVRYRSVIAGTTPSFTYAVTVG